MEDTCDWTEARVQDIALKGLDVVFKEAFVQHVGL
jgi:hypothetical protein